MQIIFIFMRCLCKRCLFMIVLALLIMLMACNPFKLVDESYATIDKESINGVDALKATLEARSDKVLESAIVNKESLREADLVVYVDKGGYMPDDALERVEAMLFEVDLKEDDEDEDDQSEEEEIEEKEAFAEEDEIESNPDEEEGHEEGYFDHDSASESDVLDTEDIKYNPVGNDKPLTKAAPAKEPLFGDEGDEDDEEKLIVKPKTFLFFLRDTDCSVPFFEKVLKDIEGHETEEQVILKHLNERKLQRRMVDDYTYPREILFGTRSMTYANYRMARRLTQSERAFPTRIESYPVRLVPDSDKPLIKDQHYYVDTLLAVHDSNGESYDLIREFQFKTHRLILVYNTEPFLNYNQVKPGNRLLLRELLNYSLNRAPSSPIVSWVGRPFPATERLPRDVENPYKMLFSFPINIILLQLLLLLIMFLLSRWPHERPPLPERVTGTREFLEHIKALGVHLKRSRNRMPVIHALLKYKRKQGLPVPDPAQFVKVDDEKEKSASGIDNSTDMPGESGRSKGLQA